VLLLQISLSFILLSSRARGLAGCRYQARRRARARDGADGRIGDQGAGAIAACSARRWWRIRRASSRRWDRGLVGAGVMSLPHSYEWAELAFGMPAILVTYLLCHQVRLRPGGPRPVPQAPMPPPRSGSTR
jgi:hypothetical protein